jgi:hypothetical protein
MAPYSVSASSFESLTRFFYNVDQQFILHFFILNWKDVIKLKLTFLWQALIVLRIGLKRKFSFSYFRENFAKIYFRFSQKNYTKIFENNENFRENLFSFFAKKLYENIRK